MEISYQDLLDDYFAEHEDFYEAHQEFVWRQVNSTVDSIIFENISIYLSGITSRVSMSFDMDQYVVTCRCPDMLTALYIMTFVSDFNFIKYKECKNPNCHTYFIPDKVHEQDFCDRHMEARRRKRQASKLREGNYSRQARPSDFKE